MSKLPEHISKCGNCYYMGWNGLSPWCRHPDHCYKIMQWGICCPDWVDMFEKDDVKIKRLSLEEIKEKQEAAITD